MTVDGMILVHKRRSSATHGAHSPFSPYSAKMPFHHGNVIAEELHSTVSSIGPRRHEMPVAIFSIKANTRSENS